MIGVVGQKHGGAPEATGRENMVAQGEFYGITGRELKQRVGESLERFGLREAADRQVKTYSGGMQRRLDLAMGLLHRPAVLFLDEPTTGLDPEARVELWREIERFAAEELMTILISTHHMEEADRLAARLAIVDRGRIVVEGTPGGLKADLEGDAIQVELADPRDSAARGALEQLAGVDQVSLVDGTLYARARDGGAAIPAVLAALDAHGVRAMSVTLARPSLEDVYLRYAGRAFHSAEHQIEEVAA
jgi:ABC-2 type transport system ATP-binding protein